MKRLWGNLMLLLLPLADTLQLSIYQNSLCLEELSYK